MAMEDVPPPSMPEGDWSEEEQALWKALWQSPMASQFDEADATTVAAYIRYRTLVLSGKASSNEASEMRHHGDSLGLSPAARRRLGWVIVDDEDEEQGE